MSFGSVATFMEQRSLTLGPETSTKALQRAVADAIQADLPEGFGIIGKAVDRFRMGDVEVTTEGIKFASVDVPPNTPAWAEVVRIMGTDVARPAVAEALGVGHLGFLNCGEIIVSDQPLPPGWLVRRQIDRQFTPHC